MIKKIFFELINYQERMLRKSKEKFRDYLFEKAESLGLDANITPKSRFAKNVVIGDLNKATVLIGAHYDTPPRMFSWVGSHPILFNIVIFLLMWGLLPIVLLIMPLEAAFIIYMCLLALLFSYLLGFFSVPNKNNYNDNTSGVLAVLNLMQEIKSEKVAFVFFDNEEKGLIGSLVLARYLKSNIKKVIVLDCIGVGETFVFYHYGSKKMADNVSSAFINLDNLYYTHEVKKGAYLATSDHLSFRKHQHVGIMALQRKKGKLIINNIHSEQDNFLEIENIRHACIGIKKFLGENYDIR